jgi:hypothetical protein
MPAGLDPAEAATLVFNYLAASQMLHRVARVTSGRRILVHGVGGGLGACGSADRRRSTHEIDNAIRTARPSGHLRPDTRSSR